MSVARASLAPSMSNAATGASPGEGFGGASQREKSGGSQDGRNDSKSATVRVFLMGTGANSDSKGIQTRIFIHIFTGVITKLHVPVSANHCTAVLGK